MLSVKVASGVLAAPRSRSGNPRGVSTSTALQPEASRRSRSPDTTTAPAARAHLMNLSSSGSTVIGPSVATSARKDPWARRSARTSWCSRVGRSAASLTHGRLRSRDLTNKIVAHTLWQTELPDHHARSYVRSQRGGIAMRPDPSTGTAHTGTAVFFGGAFVYACFTKGVWRTRKAGWSSAFWAVVTAGRCLARCYLPASSRNGPVGSWASRRTRTRVSWSIA